MYLREREREGVEKRENKRERERVQSCIFFFAHFLKYVIFVTIFYYNAENIRKIIRVLYDNSHFFFDFCPNIF